MIEKLLNIKIEVEVQEEKENDRSGICGGAIKAVDCGSSRNRIIIAAYYQI